MSKGAPVDAKQYAKRNVRFFPVLKIFTKRVFLPLAAIYFMQTAHFTFAEIGILGSFYYVVNFLSDVPTGVFADRFGRAMSLRIGALLNVFATLIYVFLPHKPAIFVGTFFEAVGYGFLLGAGEALIHDSLVVLGKVADYTKIVSRAQSLSLIVNAILLALVPMTYSIDHRLPFLIGTLAYASLGIVALILKDVHHRSIERTNFGHLGLIFKSKGALGFALGYGIIGALYTAPSDFFNLAFKQMGLQPSLLGWVFSAASIVGAIIGIFFHRVRNFPLWAILVGDSVLSVIPYIAVFIYSLPVLIVLVIASISLWRYRRIIYQEKMLTKFPGQPKATLLSIMSNLEGLQQMWMPFAAGVIIGGLGLRSGFGVMALFGTTFAIVLLIFGKRFFAQRTT